MPRKAAVVQIKEFIGGLNTEASLINFPENATQDEINIELNTDGSRSQRNSFDVEIGFSEIDTGITVQSSLETGRSQFRWYNPGGYPEQQIVVVQIGNYIGFHKVVEGAISSSRLYYSTPNVTTYSNQYGYSVVDGTLVIATGEKEVRVYEYDGSTITESLKTLYVRDFFGVEATDAVVGELTDPTNYKHRPSTMTREHLYNLRNQTFGPGRMQDNSGNAVRDTVYRFYEESGFTEYPSNADNVNRFLAPLPGIASGSKTADRFLQADMYADRPANQRAPSGYFIIDALERGASRDFGMDSLYPEYKTNNSGTVVATGSLPADITPGGARVLAQYAGRVWYAGFSATVTDGDSKSPKMSSYVLYSKIVESPSDINRCYQDADPTSPEDPDLVDSDGGFLKIDGAYGITAMIDSSDSLFIFARNGVWRVAGNDNGLFNATTYSVTKVTNFGCVSGSSVIDYSGSIFFWGEEGIYQVAQDIKTGGWSVQDITESTIKSLYESIPQSEKVLATGYYDYRTYSLRWIYGANFDEFSDSYELILNTKFGAFTRNKISPNSRCIGPTSVCGGQPIESATFQVVTSQLVQVTANGASVFLPTEDISFYPSGSFYCITIDSSPTITYSFGGYIDGAYSDWANLSGTSGDWPDAYLITGPVSEPNPGTRKDLQYLTIRCPYNGELASCNYSAQWGWSTDVNSGRWSTIRSAYRPTLRNRYIPVVESKDRVRGHGGAVSFKFESDGTYPIHILGWSYGLGVNERE